MSTWWSIALAGSSLFTMWQLSHRMRSAFVLGVLLQVGWFVYGVLSEQWGFVGSAVVFAVMNVYGWLKWKQFDDEEATRECHCAKALDLG